MYYIKRKAKKKDKPLPLFDKTGVTIKKKPDLKAKLDKEFSMYIRLRDSQVFDFRAFRCISCGQIKPFNKADCGHYFSRSHLATRFDELNCWAECSYCNRFKADHLEGYRTNLIRKIGKERFDMLKVKATSTSKISDFEYEQLIKYYKAKANKLKKEKGL